MGINETNFKKSLFLKRAYEAHCQPALTSHFQRLLQSLLRLPPSCIRLLQKERNKKSGENFPFPQPRVKGIEKAT